MLKQTLQSKRAKCHPDRPFYAKDKCRSCYEKNLRKENPEFAKRQLLNNQKWRHTYSDKKRKSDANWRAKQDKEYVRKRSRIKLLNSYGLTEDDFNKLLKKQDYKCFICRKKSNKTLHIDHCHKSGLVRGLLCFRCNFGLTFFDENYENFNRAYKYLKKFNRKKICH